MHSTTSVHRLPQLTISEIRQRLIVTVMDRQQAPQRPQPTISEQPPQPTATVMAILSERQPLLPITLAIPPQPIVTATETRLAQQGLTPTTSATPIRLILIRMAVQQELLQLPLTILAQPQRLIETCMVRHRALPHPQLIILATGIPSNVVTTLILPSGRGRFHSISLIFHDITWSPPLRHFVLFRTISNYIRHNCITKTTFVFIHNNRLTAMMQKVVL